MISARVAAVLAIIVLVSAWMGTAAAEPARAPGGAARIDHIVPITDRWLQVFVDSPAMGRIVQLDVLLPTGSHSPRPTVYLLEGGDSVLPDQNDWTYEGGAISFFSDKDVNVVLPVHAPGSYYTDWQHDDPVLGHQKWETLLTREVPPLFDARFGGNGANAVMGVSMGAQAAMMLAERGADLYRGVAAFSGCYATSDPGGQAELRYVVGSKGAEPDNMWGPPEDPDWPAHDVVANSGALRGKTVYVSSGSGAPGPHETPSNPDLTNSVIAGGPLEFAVNYCTRRLQDDLSRIAVPATFDYTPTGTHSWAYWRDQLVSSWPIIARSLGM
ncbi:alpha/beta hydrolase [Nocardia spumae]|uniref:alpha/beta hydrolase n=1 Tax=Nocardia spumae TaxID=2887190 RepID=UPI001D150671|nr:alpha/beta hydrolase family protein [Nocardia spumae]